MRRRNIPELHKKERNQIADKVRSLRQARRWTQAELARHLHLSQSRLSEIEGGDGSFTAEQFLSLLRLFNVPVSHFGLSAQDRGSQLQNALARLGAFHLHENSEIIPDEQLENPADVVRETLLGDSPRLLTAIAPVLVGNIDRINLNKLRLELVQVGFERRLSWVTENTLLALDRELTEPLPLTWAKRYRRAQTVLGAFVESISAAPGTRAAQAQTPDVLDSGIRSKKTLGEVSASSSPISQNWGIVTRLQPADFGEALRAARARA
jgi:transcriptional regulator with XRE-family HTH domain